MEVQQQNSVFQYFADTLAAVIQEAKRNGRYDMGILGKAWTNLLDLMCVCVVKKLINSSTQQDDC